MRHISLSIIALSSCKTKIIVCYDVLGKEESLFGIASIVVLGAKKTMFQLRRFTTKHKDRSFNGQLI